LIKQKIELKYASHAMREFGGPFLELQSVQDLPYAEVIYAQLINDVEGKVVVMVSTLSSDVKSEVSSANKSEAAAKVGKTLGKKAIELGISNVVFDRGGYLYHGRVQALADAAREAGLNF
jgi:ribosomal protein L18